MEYRSAYPDAGLISLTYISEVRIAAQDVARETEAIVSRAKSYNLAHHVTGALIFTGRLFAQTLEGEADTVDTLLRHIELDTRHAALIVINRRAIAARLFPHWSMAYAGSSVFVSRSLESALMPSHRNFTAAVQQLLRLIAEFARQPDGR